MRGLPDLALDRRRPAAARSAWIRARKAETRYATLLRKVARHVADIVHGFAGSEFDRMVFIKPALDRYARALEPWAESVAEKMLTETAARDRQAWREASAEIGRRLEDEVQNAPTGHVMQRLQREQVDLITSLPRQAGERVHKIVTEAMMTGTRAEHLVADVMRTGEITKNRATLIARTEVGRAATNLVQARATSIGSPGYYWKTIGDSDVRHSHKEMNGKFVAWNDPPTLDGLTGHAGALPNCRCYCSPVIPD